MERIEKLREMIKKYPSDCFSRHALAMEFLKLDKIPEAIDEMENLLLINCNYVGTYYHLAKAYEKMNAYPQALDVLERGMRVAKASAAENELRELNAAWQQLKDEIDLD
jgi:tetratricopeptide (TPR) repeat protein